jgi:hypothetical protein
VIVESIEDAVWAVNSIHSLSREAVRREFEAGFTAAQMTQDYLAVYRRLLAGQTAGRSSTIERAA